MSDTTTPTAYLSDRQDGHPPGLFLLFLVEMWERFSYYGMRGLLILYLVAVTSVRELPRGAYTNVLNFTEIQQVEGSPDTKESLQSRNLHVLVGAGAIATSDPSPKPPEVVPVLRVQRLMEVPDPNEPGKLRWIPDTSDSADKPIQVVGEPGGEFTNKDVRFRISNPTGKTVKLQAAIQRAGPGARTYFTLNDKPGTLTADIKPDAQLDPDEEPFQLQVQTARNTSGRNWLGDNASILYGWYTGLAYLFPIIGGILADKLIGTHRSMLVGGTLIAIGHIILGLSGLGGLKTSDGGMSMFIMGLAVIVLGTGHFKPCVSVMVGQLYRPGDPRRDGAFTIFYMGINLGAFLCAFVCGTLGEKVGWHWGFGSAAVGMIAGLILYMLGRPKYLAGIGEAPTAKPGGTSMLLMIMSLVLAAGFAMLFHFGAVDQLEVLMNTIAGSPTLRWLVPGVLIAAILAWVGWFLSINRPEDRGPIMTIFIFMLFNAFFWIAFEQAGSSINLFTEQNTDRHIGTFEVPATWFQSVNAGLIFILAPFFAMMWTALGKRKMNPSQPVKIALGLIFLGAGFLFMVAAGKIATGNAVKAGMFFIFMTYFWHTVGELCLSPTGLSYVTKAAPVKFVALLMGIWFVSSFIANLGGGLVASTVESIEKGTTKLPWSFGGQADFFFLFVVSSFGAAVVILVLTPLLKRLMGGRDS